MANVPRDIYAGEVDFTALALQYPKFAKKLKTNRQLDFSDPEAVRQLTSSLLHRDFGIDIDLPEDRLCPPVPNRLNYIFWLQDLLDTTGDGYRDQYDPQREVMGFDIGTGASAIYPLLGCRLRQQWRLFGTDIDEKNLQYAKSNVSRNDLSQRVRILKTSADSPLVPQILLDKVDNLDFTMCNPPFYASIPELLDSASLKSRPPNSSCTGSPVEMVVPGGEVAFIKRLITESLTHRERVQWYTTMLGKLSSVQMLVEQLKEMGCGNYAVTEFVQRGKTKRWGLGWSWQDMRPKRVARGIPGFPKHLLPFPSETTFVVLNVPPQNIAQTLDAELRALELQWHWRAKLSTGVGFALSNVWSRQARRQKAQQRDQMALDGHGIGDNVDERAAMGFKINVTEKGHETEVLVRWVKGTDAVLFESFRGMLKRKLDGR